MFADTDIRTGVSTGNLADRGNVTVSAPSATLCDQRQSRVTNMTRTETLHMARRS